MPSLLSHLQPFGLCYHLSLAAMESRVLHHAPMQWRSSVSLTQEVPLPVLTSGPTLLALALPRASHYLASAPCPYVKAGDQPGFPNCIDRRDFLIFTLHHFNLIHSP